ncbi:hypothetical protein EDC04DRAFT_2607703 [Pisolithus marmoratus]|nr:hypothetical protein EDC04DRAFT_2607703 [Pisolithus marmoratus]
MTDRFPVVASSSLLTTCPSLGHIARETCGWEGDDGTENYFAAVYGHQSRVPMAPMNSGKHGRTSRGGASAVSTPKGRDHAVFLANHDYQAGVQSDMLLGSAGSLDTRMPSLIHPDINPLTETNSRGKGKFAMDNLGALHESKLSTLLGKPTWAITDPRPSCVRDFTVSTIIEQSSAQPGPPWPPCQWQIGQRARSTHPLTDLVRTPEVLCCDIYLGPFASQQLSVCSGFIYLVHSEKRDDSMPLFQFVSFPSMNSPVVGHSIWVPAGCARKMQQRIDNPGGIVWYLQNARVTRAIVILLPYRIVFLFEDDSTVGVKITRTYYSMF